MPCGIYRNNGGSSPRESTPSLSEEAPAGIPTGEWEVEGEGEELLLELLSSYFSNKLRLARAVAVVGVVATVGLVVLQRRR